MVPSMSLLDLIIATDIIGTTADRQLRKTEQRALRRVLRKMLDRHDARWQPWHSVVKHLNERAKCHRLVERDLTELRLVAKTCFGTLLAKPLSRRVGYAELAQRVFTVEPLAAGA
jgi:hypothetical protein